MNIKLSAALVGGLLAAFGAPFASYAQQSERAADPADPAAPVPATAYVSALPVAPRAPDAVQTPDKVWRAANDALSASPDHAGHGAPPPTEQAHGQQAPAAPSTPRPVQKAPPQPVTGHGAHHH